MHRDSSEFWSRVRVSLVQIVAAALATTLAILVNTHVIKTDGPGPIGHALAIWIIIAVHKKRARRAVL